MLPRTRKLLATDAISEKVGDRIFDFGIAPYDAARPFIVCQQVGNVTKRNFCSPNLEGVEEDILQVDLYAEKASEVRDLAKLARERFNQLNLDNHVVIQDREFDTKLFRIGFEVRIVGNEV